MPKITNTDSLLLPVKYMKHMLDFVDARGGDLSKVLEASGLSAALIDDPAGQVSFQQFSDFVVVALEQSNEPAGGLLLGNQLTIMSHGHLGSAILSSEDVEQALGLIIPYVETRTPLVALSLDKSSKDFVISVKERYVLGAIRVSVIEAVITALVAAINVVSSGLLKLQKVELAFSPPSYQALFTTVFSCPVVFDAQQTRLFFPSTGLDTPLIMADKNVRILAAQKCEEEMASLRKSVPIEKRIEQILLRFQGGFPSFDYVAREMSISSRTLRRRLAEKGTSFNSLLDEVKYQLAQQYLASSDLSIQAIGYLLGYSDPSNFGRAFRKWSGISPIIYRQNLQKNE